MATIKDIATAAYVSPSTVSLVLNGNGRVSAATRTRVRAVAQRLSYSRRPVGRPLAAPAARAANALKMGILYTPRVVNQGHVYPISQWWMSGARTNMT